MDRTERFYKIQQLIHRNKVVPVRRFLDELEVSPATFKRDLEYLRSRLNIPIIWDREANGYRYDPAAQAQALPGPARAVMEVNYAIIQVRPAGAAWSSVRDVLRYVAMELAEGALPGGERYVSRDALLARRAPQVHIGQNESYGMGLMVDTTYGAVVVHHGGDLIGFHSDMMWLPEHGVGAVVLTNGDPGWILRTAFRRKLLEVLFDGNDEADSRVAAGGKAFFDGLAAERKLLTVPADPTEAGATSPRWWPTCAPRSAARSSSSQA